MKLSAQSLTLMLIVLETALPARAQRAAPTSVGPARIVCNASFCELGGGAHPGQRVRVIASRLPEADTTRLHKCTGVSAPCVVTVDGLEQGDKTKIIAIRIVWQD
jgi:hypothetical protein